VIYDELYDGECVKNLVFVAVNKRIKKKFNPKKRYNVIYEYDLAHYEPLLEEFKEASTIYHIYKNKLYQGLDYVGFAQYDMFIKEDVCKMIEDVLACRSGEGFLFYGWPVPLSDESLNGQFLIAAVNSYNNYFNTHFKFEDFESSPWISKNFVMCSTFMVPVKTFERIMPWIADSMFKYGANIPTDFYPKANTIERLYGVALAAEYLSGDLSPVHLPIVNSAIHNQYGNVNFNSPFYLYLRMREFTRSLRGCLLMRGCQWRFAKERIARFLKRK